VPLQVKQYARYFVVHRSTYFTLVRKVLLNVFQRAFLKSTMKYILLFTFTVSLFSAGINARGISLAHTSWASTTYMISGRDLSYCSDVEISSTGFHIGLIILHLILYHWSIVLFTY